MTGTVAATLVGEYLSLSCSSAAELVVPQDDTSIAEITVSTEPECQDQDMKFDENTPRIDDATLAVSRVHFANCFAN